MTSPNPENDALFLQRLHSARSGDATAIQALFDRYYPIVQRQAHRSLACDLRPKRPWIGALFSTGDVVHEVLLSVFKDLDSFVGESEGQFISFLAALTKGRLIDAVRFHEAMRRDRRRIGSPLDESSIAGSQPGPLDSAVNGEELARFCTALATFPERERLLLRGRLEHETKFEELAEDLGYPSAGAARKAFYLAQARLATKLADQKGEDQHP